MDTRWLRRPVRGDLPELRSAPVTTGTVRALGRGSTVIKVSPWVTQECLDNEVIAINLETGAYFVLEGAAAECWTSVVSGATADGVAQRLTDRYDVSEEQARADASSVLAELQQSGMVIEEDGESASEPVVTGAKLAYAAPIVQ